MPLCACIARPDEGPGGLIAHLVAVASACGDRFGTAEEKLAYLAGLAHDAAKATPAWQIYVRSPGQRKGPPHAPLGAALFAVWSERLIERWSADRPARERLRDLALDWVRMIYRHHGRLDDLESAPHWTDPSLRVEHDCAELLATCDLDGLDELVRTAFPEYDGSLTQFAADLATFEGSWRRRVEKNRDKWVRSSDDPGRDRLGMRLARLGGQLIYADRLHAAKWQPDAFAATDADGAIPNHTRYCAAEAAEAREKGASEDLIAARTSLQQEAVRTYRACTDACLFSLLLPTGYGKTLTGLRVALEAIRSGRCKRLIYVAPYISILSQAAKVIEEATGQCVFLHHHLSILASAADPKNDAQAEDHQAFDLMDTWQTPVLATTFNQLFRALFPSRAQECVRSAALDGAFVFIDEPQIVDVRVWCAFLRALRLTCEERHAQALFSTATLPPMEDGVGDGACIVPLVGAVRPVVHRYTVYSRSEEWGATDVAREANKRKENEDGERGSVACILNTVRDAVSVYHAAGGREGGWRFLAAMMLPGHKREVISEIKERLQAGEAIGVVCTQVLEAGVDLSFRSILRARPIFPSVAQAAGRANRHGEGKIAEVIVFPFLNEKRKESRAHVYRDPTANRQTDFVLATRPELAEPNLPAVLGGYYEACWRENPHTGSLDWFTQAAQGKWTALGGLEPFGASYPTAEIFIPQGEKHLSPEYLARLTEFGVTTAEELLEVYKDRERRRGLDFVGRKRLSALLRQFIVSFPRNRASSLAVPIPEVDWLWRLEDASAYSDQTGLAHHLTAAPADCECIIF